MRRRAGAVGPVRLPPHPPGLRIGLYGGSFDPPHAGHRHVALTALKRLRLHRVWWIVTPGNPLKDRGPQGGFEARLAAARRLARHPRMVATDLDRRIGTVFTVDTVRYLRARCPGAHLVWIMGADSLAGLHRWRDWRTIADTVPLAAIDRPGWAVRATRSRAAQFLRAARRREGTAPTLAVARPPAWLLLHGPVSHLSSTALRNRPASAPSG